MPPSDESLTLPLDAAPSPSFPIADADVVPEIWSVRLSLLGAVLSVPALALLLVPAINARSTAHIASFAVYGVGLLSMFISSAVFHARAGQERVLSKCVDYAAIGVMIAGNFTPYCVALGTPKARLILAVVWALALGALVLRVTRTELSKWVFVSTFLFMGSFGLLLAPEIIQALGARAAWLTLLGGAIYTCGTLFFNRYQGDVEPPGFGPHDVWHIFILAAAGTHWLVLYLDMLPGR
jgi:hemolysin III